MSRAKRSKPSGGERVNQGANGLTNPARQCHTISSSRMEVAAVVADAEAAADAVVVDQT